MSLKIMGRSKCIRFQEDQQTPCLKLGKLIQQITVLHIQKILMYVHKIISIIKIIENTKQEN